MTGDGRVRGGAAVVRWRLAATTALAVVALAGGCTLEHGQPTSGGPSTASRPPAQYTYYAQAASFSGPDAWQHAQRQAQQLAQQLRAKGLPATVYESHTEFPSHTLYFFVAVASGEYSTRDQAQAQVARLRRAGFADAKVVEMSLPK